MLYICLEEVQEHRRDVRESCRVVRWNGNNVGVVAVEVYDYVYMGYLVAL